MDINMFLAVVSEQTAKSSGPVFDVSHLREQFWGSITELHWIYSLLMLSVGVVYLLYGWRIFRVLVVISFGFLGLFLGIMAGGNLSTHQHAIVWGGVIGMTLFAIVAVPLMKWCISILGAIAGGILTSGIWVAFDLSETYLPAGFIVGFIAGGLISFILLKISIMLFTSLGGGLIMVTGLLALLYQYDMKVSEPITFHAHSLVFQHQWFIPLLIVIQTCVGIAIQNKFIKQSPKWEI